MGTRIESKQASTASRSSEKFRGEGDTLAQKLVDVVRDPDLNIALGPYITQLIVPALIAQERLTIEHGQEIGQAGLETLESLSASGHRKGTRAKTRSMRKESNFARPGIIL